MSLFWLNQGPGFESSFGHTSALKLLGRVYAVAHAEDTWFTHKKKVLK